MIKWRRKHITFMDDVSFQELSEPITVTSEHIINMLMRYKLGKSSFNELIDWVNVIWFSDCFDYQKGHEDAIASVMCELEELGDHNETLPFALIDRFITCLQQNAEFFDNE